MKITTTPCITFGVALSVCLGLSACLLEEPDVGGALAGHCSAEDSNPEVTVFFSADIRPLFDRPSAMAGCGNCHSPGGSGIALSGFDMSSLTSMRRGGNVAGNRVIVANDPCQSTLVQKLSAAPAVGARMPLSGPPYFANDEVRKVADWIAEGAEDN